MFHWVDQRAPEPDRQVICPNCQSAIPVRRVLVAATPAGREATLLACAACGARFFENADAGAYEAQPPGASAALAFYLQQGADMGGIAMRLIGLERPPGTRYLEIGCGFGLGLDIARRALGWDVKGIDPSPFAGAGRSELNLPIELRYFDANAESAAAQFDVVHASEFLEHVPAPLDALRAMKRVLRAGGTLLLTTPAAEMIDPKTSDGVLIPLLSVGWHLVIQTADSLAMLLSRVGFDNVGRSRRRGLRPCRDSGNEPRRHHRRQRVGHELVHFDANGVVHERSRVLPARAGRRTRFSTDLRRQFARAWHPESVEHVRRARARVCCCDRNCGYDFAAIETRS